jgi:hypothetical protein
MKELEHGRQRRCLPHSVAGATRETDLNRFMTKETAQSLSKPNGNQQHHNRPRISNHC